MKYKAFISYRHSENGRRHAVALETALKRYAKPTLARPMKIFRDEKHMKPNISLPMLIQEGLENSDYPIHLSSIDRFHHTMQITYRSDLTPTPEQIIELYDDAGLPRPIHDKERIKRMYEHSNLILTAWDNDLLVGVARSITDWVWSCYLADLAVRPDYQKLGIGKSLIELTKEKVGDQSMVLLLSVPSAMEYYPKIGFTKQESSFIINRTI